MTWTVAAPDPVDGAVTGPERPMLEDYLRWQRSTLQNICAGLTGEQLASRPVPTSTLSLLGLLRHLAKVERVWFRLRAAGEDIGPLFDPVLGKDHDFEATDPAEAEAALAQWQDECRLADAAAAGLDLDTVVDARGEDWSLRMVYLHMIHEYARHNGHADLLREAIDGAVGR